MRLVCTERRFLPPSLPPTSLSARLEDMVSSPSNLSLRFSPSLLLSTPLPLFLRSPPAFPAAAVCVAGGECAMAVAEKSVCPGKSPPSPFAIVFAVSEPTSFSPPPLSLPLTNDNNLSLSPPSTFAISDFLPWMGKAAA